MSKELEDLLKMFALVAVFLFIIGVALFRIRGLEKEIDALKNAPTDTITIIKTDTLRIAEPVPVYKYIKEKEYVTITDSLLVYDTITKVIELPREYLVYKDTSYRAVVSGVQPRLDSMEVYSKTITETITKTIQVPDKKRWGFGVNVSAGYDGKKVRPFVGVGVQYNVIRW